MPRQTNMGYEASKLAQKRYAESFANHYDTNIDALGNDRRQIKVLDEREPIDLCKVDDGVASRSLTRSNTLYSI